MTAIESRRPGASAGAAPMGFSRSCSAVQDSHRIALQDPPIALQPPLTRPRSEAGPAVVLAPTPAALDGPRPLSWWRELLLTIGFYAMYAAIRDAHGSATVTKQYGRALTDARQVISAEASLHIGWEHALQVASLHVRWLVRSANVFYGSAHFVVTLAVLVWLYRRRPAVYRRWRTVLAAGTAVALVGFTLFPVLPPRLLPPSYGFTDTLHSLGGLWSFNSGVVERISDPFAAMPSLHLCWATWCALVLVPGLRRRWSKALAASYPILTSAVVVITGNHYLLDLVGGVACLGLGGAVVAVPALVSRTRERRMLRLAVLRA